MNAETRQIVETELKRFAVDLNLSDEQKAQLKTGLETAREKLNQTTGDWHRSAHAARSRVVRLLTP